MITAFVGTPGSGKSYDAIKKILDNLSRKDQKTGKKSPVVFIQTLKVLTMIATASSSSSIPALMITSLKLI